MDLLEEYFLLHLLYLHDLHLLRLSHLLRLWYYHQDHHLGHHLRRQQM